MELLQSLTAYTESWIEVSSRPSSSSLSSAATDEVVTTGLRVNQSSSERRRRPLRRSAMSPGGGRRAASSRSDNDISQEEYDESESESDRVMTSSNEDLQPGFRKEKHYDDSPPTISQSTHSDGGSIESVEDDDDDENSTALGIADPTPFTPQPHAFSHPPSSRLTQRQMSSQESYFPPLPSSAGASSRQSQPATATSTTSTSSASRAHNRTRSHTPYNVIAPSHSVDHDAALRASLSTLLSCAAAARGLGKRESNAGTSGLSRPPLTQTRPRQSSRVEQGTLRIVPESALSRLEEENQQPHQQPPALPPRHLSPHSTSTSSPGSPPVPASSPATKRKAKSPARDRRKKHRSTSGYTYGIGDDTNAIAPTLTTWVVGAGVLVLFSAISFSAGYALGKEVGRVDALGNGGLVGGGSCGSEVDGLVGRGLGRSSRAWRWGNTSGVRA